MQVERRITVFAGMRSAEEYLRGLRLEVLIVIHGAAKILHRLFRGPRESVNDVRISKSDRRGPSTDPGINMFSNQFGLCIARIAASVSSLPGTVIGSNIKSIISPPC
jgi:hypothetical protein